MVMLAVVIFIGDPAVGGVKVNKESTIVLTSARAATAEPESFLPDAVAKLAAAPMA